LHDVLEDSPVLTKEVLEYNFGAYTAYLVELLTKDLAAQREQLTKIEEAFVKKLAESPIDALLIKLAARLDNFRCLQFHLKRNPFDYIQSTECHYFPLVEKSNSTAAKKLLRELKIERNKFIEWLEDLKIEDQQVLENQPEIVAFLASQFFLEPKILPFDAYVSFLKEKGCEFTFYEPLSEELIPYAISTFHDN
jgi:(p)ppGpp synthase/HD superfamily hydrolase